MWRLSQRRPDAFAGTTQTVAQAPLYGSGLDAASIAGRGLPGMPGVFLYGRDSAVRVAIRLVVHPPGAPPALWVLRRRGGLRHGGLFLAQSLYGRTPD